MLPDLLEFPDNKLYALDLHLMLGLRLVKFQTANGNTHAFILSNGFVVLGRVLGSKLNVYLWHFVDMFGTLAP